MRSIFYAEQKVSPGGFINYYFCATVAVMKTLFPLLTLLVFLCAGFAPATETATYDVILFGDKVGNMVVTHQTLADGKESYLLQSNVKAKILWIDKEVVSRMEAIFKDGKLLTSNYSEVENGEKKRWYNVNLTGNVYTADGFKGKRTITQPIPYTVVTSYFKDLRKVTRVFDEAECDFVDLAHPEPDTWEFKSGGRGRNVFHSVNGVVKFVEFHASIASVKFIRTR